MKPKYMLDTNICIYLIKNHPAEVAERFAQYFIGEVVISSITLAELEYGVVCSGEAQQHNQQALDKLIAAHAIALDVILVTNNETDFALYPNLRIENWIRHY